MPIEFLIKTCPLQSRHISLQPHRSFWAFFLIFFLWAAPALAVQQHGGAEGLVSHQIGHFLFIAGMVYLLSQVYSDRWSGPGWLQFKTFLWLIISWNLLTFSGHFLHETINPNNFVRQGDQLAGYRIESFMDLVYYCSRLDHLVLLPAFIFLFIALKKWARKE